MRRRKRSERKEMRRKEPMDVPSPEQLEKELKREGDLGRKRTALRNTVNLLITVAAAAVSVADLWLPVLQIYGSSMTPTLSEGRSSSLSRERIFRRGIFFVLL